jgi:hypothetical protein
MPTAAPSEPPPSAVRRALVAARRVVLAAGVLTCGVLLVLPSSGPAATAPRRAASAIDDPASLRRDATSAAVAGSDSVASLADRVAAARQARDTLVQQLGALTGLSYRSVPEPLPADTGADLAASRVELYADVAADALRTRLAATEHDLADAEQTEQRAIADYFAALAAAAQAQAEAEAAAQAAAASRVDASVSNASVSNASSSGGCASDVACFLACTRAHESDTAGGYQAVSPDGVYRGAYQFDQTTWNSIAAAIGRTDLVGTNPAAASPTDQDTLATALYEVRGNAPWGGRC